MHDNVPTPLPEWGLSSPTLSLSVFLKGAYSLITFESMTLVPSLLRIYDVLDKIVSSANIELRKLVSLEENNMT